MAERRKLGPRKKGGLVSKYLRAVLRDANGNHLQTLTPHEIEAFEFIYPLALFGEMALFEGCQIPEGCQHLCIRV
jgi:hypothetical protein